MTRRILTAGLLALTLAFTATAGDPPAKAEATKADATKTDPAQAGLEKMKKLAGTWVEADKNGKPTDKVVSVIKVIAAGSVVQETNFPGEAMEMVSMYHLDQGELVMTHYCAIGNQPKMKADFKKSAANQIQWAFAGGTNLDPTKDMHMHSAKLTFVDDDHIEVAGEAWEGGKPAETHCGTMKLVRKK